MKKIERDYRTLLKAYASLQRGVDSYKNPILCEPKNCEMLAISLTKRFEYCYEMTWRYYRMYINKKLEKIKTTSGKKVFYALHGQKQITAKEKDRFLLMIKQKKKFVHQFDFALEKKLYRFIPGHYSIMKRVIKRFEP